MTIQQILTKIQNETYGEEVRQAIADGLQLCYDDKVLGGYCPVDDLNNYYSGATFCTSSVANGPSQSSFIVMSAGDSDHCFQAAINILNINDGYTRKKQSGSWSSWMQLGVSKKIRYWNHDGTILLYTESVSSGGNGSWTGVATREPTQQYEYTFVGWSTSMNSTAPDSNATRNITSNRDVYAAFTSSLRSYNVYFFNGTALLSTVSIPYGGNALYDGVEPTKASTAQYNYTFVGWNSHNGESSAEVNVLNDIRDNKTVYAAFASAVRSYNVYFYNGSNLMFTDTVEYGSSAVYEGSAPTKASTAQYSYAFSGWNTNSGASAADSNALVNIVANRNVYAMFVATIRTYTVRFMNAATVLQTIMNVPYGGDATYTGNTPQHPTEPDEYTFVGFDPDGTNIIGATDCQAVYILNPKELRYWNYNGTELLHTELVEVGGDGSWNGTSSRDSTAEHSYIFLGWSTSMNASVADPNATKTLTADRDVYAAFQETTRSYSVLFYNGSTLLYTDHVQYGENASYVGDSPTKASTAQYTYTFTGWNSQDGQSSAEANVLNNITTDKTVYAAFSSTLVSYHVYFYNNTSLLYTDTVDYGSNASYSGTAPTKASTVEHTYTFVGWNSQNDQTSAETGVLNNITADKTVYAAFSESARYYTVRFMNGGTVLQTSQVAYGTDAAYTGETPIHPTDPDNWVFARFEPDGTNIIEDTDCVAVWREFSDDTRKLVSRSISGVYNNSMITVLGPYAFANCSSLTEVTLPEVTHISGFAFKECLSLQFLSLPKVVNIAGAAFYNCSSLRSMVVGIDASVVCSIASNAFATWSCTFYVADSMVNAYKQALVWSTHSGYIKPVSQLPTT